MAAASVGADPRPPEPEPGAAGAGRVDGGDERAIRECSAGLARALKGAIAAARRLRGRETQRAGEVAHAQYALLFELAERDELTAGELAAAADLAPATVTGMLDHLVAAGLVDRGRPGRDRRLVVCRLTDTGRARVAARRARLEPLWNAAIAEFDPRELGIATAVLDRLRIFFETLDEADGQP